MFFFDSLYYRLFRLLPSKKLRARYEQKYQRLKRFKKLPEILETEINRLKADNDQIKALFSAFRQDVKIWMNGNLRHTPYDVLMASDVAANNTLNIQPENFDHVYLSVASSGNSVTIEQNPFIGRVRIEITGKNNIVRLGDLTNVTGPLDIFIRGDNTVTDIGSIYLGTGGFC